MTRSGQRWHASSAGADLARRRPRVQAPDAPPTRRFTRLALWWFVLAAAVLLLDVPICPVAGLLGWPCPGCGLSRAGLALLHGEFATAWRLHPLIYVVVPCMVAFGVKLILDVRSLGRGLAAEPRSPVVDRQRDRRLSVVAGLGLALLLGVWLARAFGAFGGPVAVETYARWLQRVGEKW